MKTKEKTTKTTAKVEKAKKAIEQVKITNVDEFLENICKAKSEDFVIAKAKQKSKLAEAISAEAFEHLIVAEKHGVIIKYVWDTREVTNVIEDKSLFPLEADNLLARVRDNKKPLVSTDKNFRKIIAGLI